MELFFRQIADGVMVPDDPEYIEIVTELLQHPKVQSMKEFIQHGRTDCLEHSIAVSYRSYLSCKKMGLDYGSAARAGLLHDFFLYDWHKKKDGRRFHGFTHPGTALKNAEQEFALNKTEREIIRKHMWPLTLVPPRHLETYVVLYHDKVCSTKETFMTPGLRAKVPA